MNDRGITRDRLSWLGDLAQDLRFGFLQLRKAPGFAAVAILTVAIGIGACTALFSVVNAVLLRPLDYENPDALVQIHETWLPKYPQFPTSTGAYYEWVNQSSSFTGIAAISGRRFNLTEGEHFKELFARTVTENYFSIHGLKAELGRTFLAEDMEPGKDRVIILSRNAWQSRFGGRAEAIGETLLLDDQPYTVIGVVHDPQWTRGEMYYVPAVIAAQKDNFANFGFWPIARLKPGISVKQAQAEMDVIARRIAQQHPDTHKDHGVVVVRVIDSFTGSVRLQLYVLLGAVGSLLLIACVNVACLLLARTNARQREIAVRASLGAGRGRIVRQFLCESVVISVIGGILGTLIAYASMGPLRVAARLIPRVELISIDHRVLLATFGLMLLTGLGLGLVPALQATRGNMIDGLKEGGNSSGSRRRQRARTALVVVEIALALVLLTGAGLLIRSLRAMQQFDQGLRYENVHGNQFLLNSRTRYGTPEKILGFTNEVLERVHAMPDTHSAAITIALPMGNRNAVPKRQFLLEGTAQATALANQLYGDSYAITPEYFKVMSIPLLKGRGIEPQDTLGSARVVVINREMVRRFFPDREPLGQRVRFLSDPKAPEVWCEIVGVVGDVRPWGPTSDIGPQIYEAFNQVPQAAMTLMIKTKSADLAVPNALPAMIHAIDPNIAFERMYPYEATISFSWRRQQFGLQLFTLFSIIALGLSAIGIYGVMAYSVSQRTHEIGIHMALGALPRDVLHLILGSGSRIVASGVLLGVIGSLACSRLMTSLLFQTNPRDPITYILIVALLSIVALLACWFPALRAAKVDPLVALRHD